MPVLVALLIIFVVVPACSYGFNRVRTARRWRAFERQFRRYVDDRTRSPHPGG